MEVQKKFLGVNDVATKMGVTSQTVYNWVRNKKIPFSKPVSKIYFDEEEIENWIAKSSETKIKATDLFLEISDCESKIEYSYFNTRTDNSVDNQSVSRRKLKDWFESCNYGYYEIKDKISGEVYETGVSDFEEYMQHASSPKINYMVACYLVHQGLAI